MGNKCIREYQFSQIQMTPWKLKRTTQCEKCPWRKDVDPTQIPRGYDTEKHRNLKQTIATESVLNQVYAHLSEKPLHMMACHEEHDAHCIGWLTNQIGPGNNIGLRLHMRSCENWYEIELAGEQHETFEDTLPKL